MEERILLESILMDENPILKIQNQLNDLLHIIPEISLMIGFEHRHPHHHLDVWEHTLLAISKSEKNIEIRLVLLLHDIGKPLSYQDDGFIRHFKNHSKVSSEIANQILKRLNYSEEEISEIVQLILLHDTPITNLQIEENKDFCIKLYQIQYCDALAHNPTKLKKRIEYLNQVSDKLFLNKTKIISRK